MKDSKHKALKNAQREKGSMSRKLASGAKNMENFRRVKTHDRLKKIDDMA